MDNTRAAIRASRGPLLILLVCILLALTSHGDQDTRETDTTTEGVAR